MMNQERLDILKEIENFDTKKLIEVLQTNGLEDCCHVIEEQQLTGFEFLNLIEVRIKLWKKLNRIQMTRLWSAVQLASQNPEMFYSPLRKKNKAWLPTNSTNNIYTPEPKNSTNPSYEPIKNKSTLYKFQTGNSSKSYSENCYPPKAVENTHNDSEENLIGLNFERVQLGDHNSIQKRPLPTTSNKRSLPLPPSNNQSQWSKNSLPKPTSTLYKPPQFPLPPEKNPCISNAPLPLPPQSRSSVPSQSRSPVPSQSRSPVPSQSRSPVPPQMIYETVTDQTQEEEYYYDDFFNDLTYQAWYRRIDRRRANRLLADCPNGSFVVRPSSKPDHICILSLIYNNKIYNFPINKITNTQLVIGRNTDKQFTCVNEIIDYYTQYGLPLNYENLPVHVKLCHFN